MAEVGVIVPQRIDICGGPVRDHFAGGVDGNVVPGLEHCGDALQAVAGHVVALAGEEFSIDPQIEFPAQAFILEDFTMRDAAGRNPVDEKQARAGFEIEAGFLDIAGAGVRDEGLGDPFEEAARFNGKLLLTGGRLPGACAEDAGGTWGAQDQPGSLANGDPDLKRIAIEESRSRVDDSLDKEFPVVGTMGLAEMDGCLKSLIGDIGDAIRTGIAAQAEVPADGVPCHHLHQTKRYSCFSQASSASLPFSDFRSAKMTGLSPRWVLASRAITSRSAPT